MIASIASTKDLAVDSIRGRLWQARHSAWHFRMLFLNLTNFLILNIIRGTY